MYRPQLTQRSRKQRELARAAPWRPRIASRVVTIVITLVSLLYGVVCQKVIELSKGAAVIETAMKLQLV